jgi:hypothetical protein
MLNSGGLKQSGEPHSLPLKKFSPSLTSTTNCGHEHQQNLSLLSRIHEQMHTANTVFDSVCNSHGFERHAHEFTLVKEEVGIAPVA